MNPPDPRAILREAGLAPKKSWGQNFLCDQSVLAAIAEATGAGPAVPAVELGAGLGALTYHLLSTGGFVVAVERDRELVPLLRSALGTEAQLEIIEADAAALDFGELAVRLGTVPVVCGNLPYQLSSRIIVSIADQSRSVRKAVLMVQLEVAQRIVARPGSRTYGLLSVLVQRALDGTVLRKVPPGAFHPRPKVTSAVVALEPLASIPDAVTDRRLVAVARAAFATRRKTLKNALCRGLMAKSDLVTAAIVEAELDPAVRAERLTIDDFNRIAARLAEHGVLD